MFEVKGDTSTPDPQTVLYENDEVITIANVNRGKAYIVGGSLDFRTEFMPHWSWRGNLTYTQGKSYDDHRPLPSISPFFGSAAFSYQKDKLEAILGYRFSLDKDPEDYSPGGEDNLEQSPEVDPDPTVSGDSYFAGHPAWNVFDVTAIYHVTDQLGVQVGLENIFDVHYKEFASAISAPGRNFRLTVDFSF